ncbi:MAG TPA: hypothetical protein VM871_08945 [Flavisolibacter sp.]|nr:hypothetical protein [Flavisolibacter sp.]
MKPLFLFFSLLFCSLAFAQSAKVDLAKETTSAERKAMLEALKMKLQPSLRLKPKMVVEHLWVKSNFAFFRGAAKDANGRDIDFSKTEYKQALEDGAFDGESTFALLKKVSGKWKVLAWALGPTDVPYTCWWSEFKAPKDIFDHTDNCR